MRLIFIILFFYCSNILSSEENKTKELDSFFNKKPAEQREIFINEFRKIILNKNTSVEKVFLGNPSSFWDISLVLPFQTVVIL